MKPNFAIISERVVNNSKVVEVDTSEAKYQGVSWRTMGDYGKRKFENLLALERQAFKIIYV